jgi:hypothetical protein
MDPTDESNGASPTGVLELSGASGSNASSPSPNKTKRPLVQRAVRKVTA